MLATKYVKASKKSLSLLAKCLTLSQANQIQSHLTVTGTLKDPYASGKLVSLYTNPRISDLSHSHRLFLRLQTRSTFVWNILIGAFAERNQSQTAISLYKNLLESGFFPNNYTFSFVLKACGDLLDLSLCFGLHGQVLKRGWESYDFVLNGLIHMYVCSGCVECARKLFDEISNRDVISWTALIDGYVKSGDVVVARELFDEMPVRNSVSWGVMISGYTQVGLFKDALEVFSVMQVSGTWPNHAALISGLTACAFLGAFNQGRWMHAYVKRFNIGLDAKLGAALIDMYAKCGCIEMARNVFNEMPKKDVYVYSCLISGLANNGESVAAFELFEEMNRAGVPPNDVTFICVLNACSRVGMVDEGLRIFETMSKVYGIEPRVEHYGCLVDLLGRAGRLEEAKKVVREMSMEPDSYVLGALLDACRVHGDVELGKETVQSLVRNGLEQDGAHVLLSNLYASANKWDDVVMVRKGMGEKNLKKVPGCSLIEVDGSVLEFVAGDRSRAVMALFEFDWNLDSLCI